MRRLLTICNVVALTLISFNSNSQIPQKAISIADSICQTRLLCSNTKITLVDSIFYPKIKTKYYEHITESYFFKYKVHLKDEITTDLNISINQDFTVKYVSGLPDGNYTFNPCQILSREKLWQVAKKNGLGTKYAKCSYHLSFEDDGIFIRFHEKKSRWDLDAYSVNALTGIYTGHAQMNVTF
jgi:hypothetical protein